MAALRTRVVRCGRARQRADNLEVSGSKLAIFTAVPLVLAGCVADPFPEWTPLRDDPALARQLLGEAEPASAEVAWEAIGRSLGGRPIEARTFGAGRKRIYVIGGIHGDEPEGLAAAEAVRRRFVADRRSTIRWVRDMNPDGTAARTRGNSRGVDLNRNWPASNFEGGDGRGGFALSEPETLAVYRDLLAFGPDAVVVLHSSVREHAPFVNYDGPAAEVARAWSGAAAGTWAWPVIASMGYPTPGSIGTFVGVDRQIPILTIEFRRGQDGPSVRQAVLAGLEALRGELGSGSLAVAGGG